MSRFFDEKFEGAGYEESWLGETVGSGCSLDEDANTSDILGSPPDWDDQCLKVVSASPGFSVYNSAFFSGEPNTWFRAETIITSEDLGEIDLVTLYYAQLSGRPAWIVYLYQISGFLFFLFSCNHDGSPNSYISDPIALNTRYRIEIEWDATSDTWEWKINGVSQDNGALTLTHEPGINIFHVGVWGGTNNAATIYHDLIAWDDADWVGSEPYVPSLPAIVVDSTLRRRNVFVERTLIAKANNLRIL